MKLLNLNLITPMNMIAVGAIVFFWGAAAFFLKEEFAPSVASDDAK